MQCVEGNDIHLSATGAMRYEALREWMRAEACAYGVPMDEPIARRDERGDYQSVPADAAQLESGIYRLAYTVSTGLETTTVGYVYVALDAGQA